MIPVFFKGLGILLSFGTTSLLSNKFGAGILGEYATNLSVLNLIAVFTRLGHEEFLLKSENNSDDRDSIFSIMVSIFCTLPIFIVFSSFEQLPAGLQINYWFIIPLFLYPLEVPLGSWLINKGNVNMGAYFLFLNNSLMQFLGLLFSFFIRIEVVSTIHFMYSLPGFVALPFIVSKFFMNSSQLALIADRPKFRVHWWFYFLRVFNVVYTWLDKLLVGIFLSPVVASGYFVCWKLAQVSSVSQNVIQTTSAPGLANSSRSGEISKLRKIISHVYLKNLLITTISNGVMLSSFGSVAHFFGIEVESSFDVFYVMIIVQFINALTGPAGMLLKMSGYEKTVACVRFMVTVCIVSIYLILPFKTALVTALCFGFASAVINLALFTLVKVKYGFLPVPTLIK